MKQHHVNSTHYVPTKESQLGLDPKPCPQQYKNKLPTNKAISNGLLNGEKIFVPIRVPPQSREASRVQPICR
jgi:hypothetical protein